MAVDGDTFAMLREAVRRFVDERLIPAERRVAEEDRIGPELIAEMRALGLYGLSIPEAWGGLGLGMAEEVEIAMELGRAAPAFRSAVGTNIGIGSQALVLAGTEAQRRRWLPGLASGEIVGSFCLTEPDAGSDAASLRTRAVRRPDGAWVLDGTKRYITNAPEAGLFTVMARTSEAPGAAGISCFLVERDAPGLSLGRPDRKMGQQGAHTCDVILDGCVVPADALLGEREGEGFRVAMRVLDKGRLHIAAVCVGAATRLIDEAVAYGRTRRQFGRPIAEFQLVQAMLADSYAETYAARTMVRDAARRRDAGETVTLEASACKMFASEMVGRVADRAVQIHGGAGYMAEYEVERFFRDVRLFRLYEGTTQIQQLVIARELIKRAG
ncbi:Acyl-CoA dehydrogenase [Rhodoplanes serenus]|jgi:acyl-CoA dehydrogenase|uniref:Acyl-CoA dehydrogenase n=1 Tax=Rhodoplanes serenus TaxID=200615 RepID=A0A3S4FFC8_9BRAD|nr:acyl-CoA dehydrogenase family protein [Rhodoplanes serenus]MBI5113122.1 acyl-CoA dehydrogenase family protein [Rhodovulum sp.]VCU10896.1 Acyl-CoA dehydrogenase [Rhodoplanes serenus]